MVLGNTLNILRPPGVATLPIQTGWNEALVKNMHKVLGELAQQLTAQTFGGYPEGTSRPAAVTANGFWYDITSATVPILKLFDGTDDITVMTFDYTTNTVTFPGVLSSFDLVDDTSPQLGGTLDLNGNVITGLEIGTDVQALDATLSSLAAVAGVTGDILYASGTDTWTRLAKDTDADILTLVSGLPSWVSPVVASSGLIALTAFPPTSSPWTPHADATTALIFCTGGGGSGERSNSEGAGGGAGATAIDFVADTTGISSETVTIGTGATGNGGNGNASSVGSLASAGGGKGGNSGGNGGSGGTATVGDMLISGGGGSGGDGSTFGGVGGASFWGGGARGRGADGAGFAGLAYGSGGGGGLGSIQNGGDGSDGVVLILEW